MDRGVTQPMRGRRHLAVFVLENAEAVRMPGERGNAELRARQANGIPLNARLAGTLAKLATECGVDVPEALKKFA